MNAEQNAAGHVPPAVQELLARLRAQPAPAGRGSGPLADAHAELRAVPRDADCVARFMAAAQAAGVRAQRATAATWPGVVREILAACDESGAIVLQSEAGTAFGEAERTLLAAELARAGRETTTARDDATLFASAASVTGVRAAIAETGSVICTSGPDLARGCSLIAPVHVALVGAGQIVADLFDAFDVLGAGELPANMNIITGPSKTADIEGVLVTGVHGPGQIHVVIVE
jgi:L-lactate dehydrogenase complex protein LldG